MDTGDSRSELRYSDGEHTFRHVTERSLDINQQRSRDGDCWRLVDVLLSGGAPWGFTLRGGREHREPLLITKVEEGSKAAGVSLQVGDELVNINEIPLSGYRQEAICLVKGSHKTLTLVVKRRNEPASRPHSWHSTKFNESQSETAKTQTPPTTVWHTKYDASSSSTDLSSGWDQTNLRRVSDQFSSLGSMDSLDHVPHSYPPGRLSPAKSHNNSVELIGGGGGGVGGGGGKRDSAYSSFSTSSGTPDYTLSKSNAASTENMLYKVNQWDSGGRQASNGRHSQSLSEGLKGEERGPGYLQFPGGGSGRDSPRTEEQPGSRQSSSSRASFGPVWHVPEKKKTASPSPPPPAPPVRSDSFAATKVHEKGLIIAYPEATDPHGQPKPPGKGPDKGSEPSDGSKRSHDGRRGPHSNPPAKNDGVNHPHVSADNHGHNQLSSNTAYSGSSTDVRPGQPPPYSYQAYHQRQYSNESALLAPPGRAPSAAKPQSVGGYYSSLQELPTSTSAQLYSPSQGRTPSVSSLSVEQNPEGGGGAQNRYYCVTARQAGQHSSQGAVVKADDRKAPAGPTATADMSVDKRSLSPPRYTPPQQQQQPHSTAKENNGYKHSPTVPPSGLESLAAKPVPDDRDRQRGNGGQHPATYYTSYPPSQSEQRRSLPQQQREIPPSLRQQEAGKICPQSTPMLHSLSKETLSVQGPPPREPDLQPEGYDPLGTKQTKRSERFATTLRNEIAVRRAKLQKSQSAATLCGPEDEEEEATRAEAPAERDTRRPPEGSPADSSFTSIYKDHLKEAQARVLKATSFRRRDLEPVLLEHGGVDASPGWEAPSGRGRNAALPSLLNETPRAGSAAAGGQVTRIGGRKRFATEKKVRSFSEPDKIHEVGVEEDAPPSEGSLHNRRMIFENTGKTAFTKAYPKLSTHSCSEDPREGKSRAAAPTDDGHRGLRSRAAPSTQEAQGSPYSSHRQALLEQQRLGTFAEYEATWSSQKKPLETRGSGQYRSADNILDQGGEEPAAPVCVHERSRSSPSADFYGQKISALGRKSADYYQPETKPAEQDITATRFSDRGHGNYRATDKSTEFGLFPEPPPPPVTGDDAESRATAPGPGGPVYHPGTSISPSPVTHPVPPPHPEDQAPSQHPSGGWRKTAPPYRPPTARLDKPRRPEVSSTPSDAHEAQSGPRGGASQMTELNPALAPPGHHRGVLDRGNGASPSATASNHPPAPPLSQPLPPPPSPPLPSPPPVAVATSPVGASVLADSAGSMQRSPSPQFAPQRLTDKPPPVSLQDVEPSRMENVTENNLSVKKVPIKIVHAESVTEKESRQYLLHSDPGAAGLGGGQQVASLGSPEKEPAYSLFCAYTRQREPDTEREPELRDHQDPGGMNPPGDPSSEGPPSIQALPPLAPEPTEPPGNNSEGAGPAGPSEPEHPEEEEKKREELARDIMGKDRALADILDESKRKTTMDLMEGIFPQGEQVLEGASQRKKVAPKHTSPRAPEERNDEESPAVITLVTSSTYYSTSVPKAELLIKMKDMQEQEPEEQDSEEELDIDLANKKQELIDSLSKKLQVLRDARESLQEDVLDNNALGQEVEASVQQVCKPNQLDKFRMFVGDLDKVVSLLLSLSGRLARVENALNSLDEDASPEERRTLTEKRKLLIRQHEDAKELKENLDRRERVVYDVLASCLPEESMEDYEHFVKMKSALIIEQRKLEDKIKLGEEQLKCLTDSLPLDQRPLL